MSDKPDKFAKKQMELVRQIRPVATNAKTIDVIQPKEVSVTFSIVKDAIEFQRKFHPICTRHGLTVHVQVSPDWTYGQLKIEVVNHLCETKLSWISGINFFDEKAGKIKIFFDALDDLRVFVSGLPIGFQTSCEQIESASDLGGVSLTMKVKE